MGRRPRCGWRAKWSITDFDENTISKAKKRFASYVPSMGAEGCWEWKGPLGPGGYGVLFIPHRRRMAAHRFWFEIVKGPVDKTMTLDHLCENRSCVNPIHLAVATLRKNVLRSLKGVGAVNRRKVMCKRGHKLVPNPYVPWRLRNRRRWCPTCARELALARRRLARRTSASKQLLFGSPAFSTT